MNPTPVRFPSVQHQQAHRPVVLAATELPAPADDPAMSAGSGMLMALGAGMTGLLIGGVWGAGSGIFIAGGVRNAYRAYQFWRSGTNPDEASKSGLVSAIGMALGGWLGYNAVNKDKEHETHSETRPRNSDRT